jgi:hypothetical protein
MPLFRGHAPSPAPAPSPGDGGGVYGPYIKSLLDYELTRKSGLEARASAVVTTAGTLVTLLFGLVAVVTGANTFRLPGTAHGWLIAAVILFVIAIGLAVAVVVIPHPYGQVNLGEDPAQLWKETASSASVHVAEAQVKLIAVVRQRNATNARLILVSGIAELLALAMLAVAVILILVLDRGRAVSSGRWPAAGTARPRSRRRAILVRRPATMPAS